MIVTIDTDKKEIVIEKATVQEIYECVAKFELLDYSIVSKQSFKWYPTYTSATIVPYGKKSINTPSPYYPLTGNNFDTDKTFEKTL